MEYFTYPLSGMRKEAGFLGSVGKKLHRALTFRRPGESLANFRIRANTSAATRGTAEGLRKIQEIRSMAATRAAASIPNNGKSLSYMTTKPFGPSNAFTSAPGQMSKLTQVSPADIMKRGTPTRIPGSVGMPDVVVDDSMRRALAKGKRLRTPSGQTVFNQAASPYFGMD